MTTNLKKPLTKEDLNKAVDEIIQLKYGRVEAVIGEGRIVEINVQKKIRES